MIAYLHMISTSWRVMKTVANFVTIALWVLSGLTTGCGTLSQQELARPKPTDLGLELETVNELRPKLARLHSGESEREVFEQLRLNRFPFPFEFGCLHQWNYVYDLAPNYTLTVCFVPDAQGSWVLYEAKLSTPRSQDGIWIK